MITRLDSGFERALDKVVDLSGVDSGGDWGYLRKKALEFLHIHGLPTRQTEEFKYTDLGQLLRDMPTLAERQNWDETRLNSADSFNPLANTYLAHRNTARLVVVNGYFAPELSDLAEIKGWAMVTEEFCRPTRTGEIKKNFQTKKDQEFSPANGLLALNTALATSGLRLEIIAGAKPQATIEIANIVIGDQALTASAHRKIVIGEDAEVKLIQSYIGPDQVAYVSTDHSEIIVKKGAKLHYCHCQCDGNKAIHLDGCALMVDSDADIEYFIFSAGSLALRSELKVNFEAENSMVKVSGCSLVDSASHSDIAIQTKHIKGGCTARQLFKTVVGNSASSTFQGNIVVFPDAQKTDSSLLVNGLLLADDSEFNSKPELEIFADDVQCGHGSTTGQPDEKQIHYLMTRGIARSEAEKLITIGFILAALNELSDVAMGELFAILAYKWCDDALAGTSKKLKDDVKSHDQ